MARTLRCPTPGSLLPEAGAERTLEAVSCTPWLGGRATDAVEVIELQHRSLDCEHLQRKAFVQAIYTRLPLKPLKKRACHVLFDSSMSV